MLPQSFFNKDVETLAKDLLGCELVHKSNSGFTAGIIVETECYHQTDEASHSYRGKTPRNSVMFGPPGHVYVYFTYGMHWCFNIVAEEACSGAAVLIRALQPTSGIDLMKKRRGKENLRDLCSGPSKLVQATAITKEDYGLPLYQGDLYINSRKINNFDVSSGPRIGISRAKDRPWRFWIKNNPYISK